MGGYVKKINISKQMAWLVQSDLQNRGVKALGVVGQHHVLSNMTPTPESLVN